MSAETGPALDTETEVPPPLGIFVPTATAASPEGEAGAGEYDQWGNIKTGPVRVMEENHGENFIKIFLYETARGEWFFGFQLKMEKIVRQKRANMADPPHRTAESARLAARNMIVDICRKNHGIKKAFADFTVIRYNQPELF
jgi:hypothetical protein